MSVYVNDVAAEYDYQQAGLRESECVCVSVCVVIGMS